MTDAHGVARDQLRAFIERIERLEEEKKTIADDIKDVYGEAKGMGFDTAIMKRVISLRKKDAQQRMEEEAVLDTYLAALGMIEQPDFFHEAPAATREDRAKSRTTEAMADHKTLVDEMADAGLISEEARHENKALADAVAAKFGNGPAKALQSPRMAAEAVSERAVINPVANVEEEATGAIAAASYDPASRTDEDSERQHSSTVGFADDCRTGGKEQSDASAAPVGDAAADAHGIPEPDQPLTGGDHVALNPHAATRQAGGLVQKPPAKPLRPHCLRPENCGGYGSNHCFSCKKAATAGEVAA